MLLVAAWMAIAVGLTTSVLIDRSSWHTACEADPSCLGRTFFGMWGLTIVTLTVSGLALALRLRSRTERPTLSRLTYLTVAGLLLGGGLCAVLGMLHDGAESFAAETLLGAAGGAIIGALFGLAAALAATAKRVSHEPAGSQ